MSGVQQGKPAGPGVSVWVACLAIWLAQVLEHLLSHHFPVTMGSGELESARQVSSAIRRWSGGVCLTAGSHVSLLVLETPDSRIGAVHGWSWDGPVISTRDWLNLC